MLIIVAVIVITAGYFLFRSKKAPAALSGKLPTAYAPILNREIEFYQKLDKSGKAKFEKLAGEFLHYVRIEGVGTEITDIDNVLIASSAILVHWIQKDLRYPLE